MGRALNGITDATPTNLLVDAGVIVRNWHRSQSPSEWNIIGASTGGIKVSIIPTIYQPAFDGVPEGASVKNTERITGWVASIETTLQEVPREALLDMLPGSSWAESGDYDVITPGTMDEADYYTNVSLLVTHSADTTLEPGAVFMILNPRGDGGLSLDTKPNADATLAVKYISSYDPDNMDMDPWRIYMPASAHVS